MIFLFLPDFFFSPESLMIDVSDFALSVILYSSDVNDFISFLQGQGMENVRSYVIQYISSMHLLSVIIHEWKLSRNFSGKSYRHYRNSLLRSWISSFSIFCFFYSCRQLGASTTICHICIGNVLFDHCHLQAMLCYQVYSKNKCQISSKNFSKNS